MSVALPKDGYTPNSAMGISLQRPDGTMGPVVTIKVLDLAPDRRGLASSLQAFVGSVANGLVAGVIAPLVMHSTLGLAAASAAFLCIGLVAWQWVRKRVP